MAFNFLSQYAGGSTVKNQAGQTVGGSTAPKTSTSGGGGSSQTAPVRPPSSTYVGPYAPSYYSSYSPPVSSGGSAGLTPTPNPTPSYSKSSPTTSTGFGAGQTGGFGTTSQQSYNPFTSGWLAGSGVGLQAPLLSGLTISGGGKVQPQQLYANMKPNFETSTGEQIYVAPDGTRYNPITGQAIVRTPGGEKVPQYDTSTDYERQLQQKFLTNSQPFSPYFETQAFSGGGGTSSPNVVPPPPPPPDQQFFVPNTPSFQSYTAPGSVSSYATATGGGLGGASGAGGFGASAEEKKKRAAKFAKAQSQAKESEGKSARPPKGKKKEEKRRA